MCCYRSSHWNRSSWSTSRSRRSGTCRTCTTCFLADATVIRLLPEILGKAFYGRKRLVTLNLFCRATLSFVCKLQVPIESSSTYSKIHKKLQNTMCPIMADGLPIQLSWISDSSTSDVALVVWNLGVCINMNHNFQDSDAGKDECIKSEEGDRQSSSHVIVSNYWERTFRVSLYHSLLRIPTDTGKPGKIREVIPVWEKSGNFRILPENRGKVREFYVSQGQLDQGKRIM